MEGLASYEVVKYKPQFRNDIIRLQTHLWSSNLKWNSAYFHWKYESNPYIVGQLIYLVVYRNEIVAMRGLYGGEWEAGDGGCRFQVPCAGDLVVLPTHRGKWLFNKIDQYAATDLKQLGFCFAFNFSGSPSTVLLSLRSGWLHAGAYSRMVRTPEPLPEVGGVEGGGLRNCADLRAESIEGQLEPILSSPIRCRISVEAQSRPTEMAALVRRLPWDGRIRHVRDEQYFSWRYRNPLSQYTFVFGQAQCLDGYLVLQSPLNRPRRLREIADWEACRSDVRWEILQAAISQFGADPMGIETASLDSQSIDMLQAAGFRDQKASDRRVGYQAGLLVRYLNDPTVSTHMSKCSVTPSALANWDLRMAYSDSY
jgi:hypothetical protein